MHACVYTYHVVISYQITVINHLNIKIDRLKASFVVFTHKNYFMQISRKNVRSSISTLQRWDAIKAADDNALTALY